MIKTIKNQLQTIPGTKNFVDIDKGVVFRCNDKNDLCRISSTVNNNYNIAFFRANYDPVGEFRDIPPKKITDMLESYLTDSLAGKTK